MSYDLFCKLYVNFPEGAGALKQVISETTSAHADGFSLSLNGVGLDVTANKFSRLSNDDTFMTWPVCVDIEPDNDDVSFDDFLTTVKKVLGGLKMRAINVVPACQFEELLD